MINEQIFLTDLPEEIYFSFRDYLLEDDYQQLRNTSKRIFLEIRRKSIIYHLTEKYSIKYCEDENYRNQLIEKVENPFKQIRIKLDYLRIKQYEYLFDLVPVHLIHKGEFQRDPYASRHVKELILYSSNLDITSLLNGSQCEKINFRSCSGITNTSLLKDCEHVTLDSCDNITDFSSLGKQRTLVILDSRHLNNVLNLRSIKAITLTGCNNLEVL